MKKQKLELTWIGKENRPRPEPRILHEDPSISYHETHRVMNLPKAPPEPGQQDLFGSDDDITNEV